MNEEFPILIVEDDENDVILLQRALRLAGFKNAIHITQDGFEAIRYLKGDPPYENRAVFRFPRLLITDLKTPRMNGFELLGWLQQHKECSIIPTLVFSASDREEDVQRAYQLGANSYLVKPIGADSLTKHLRLVFDYWDMCRKPTLRESC